ncbi:WD40-repeat-containing domain protein [Globomyces pollinis-pini]|nr:WD40-repeat-containing domain protein [Globomyces pollinis-pini]
MDLLPVNETVTLKGHEGPINCAIFNQDGNYCLTGSADRSIKLWNPHTGMMIKTYKGHGKEISAIQLPKTDNSRFVSGSGDRNVYIWDVQTGKTVQRFQDHTQRVNSVDFNKDGTIVVSGSYDSTVRLWDCRSLSKKPLQILSDSKDSIESVCIVDFQIVTGSVDGSVRVYDIRNRTMVEDKVGFPVTSVQLSNDRNCILVATLDNTIRLFDKETGELLCDYQGHVNSQYRLSPCFTSTDSHVISGSEDGKIHFWDLVEGQIVKTLDAHSRVVTSVKYHPNLHTMISCSFDGTAKLWTS